MEYLYHIVIICSLYGILALSLNLVMGYTGLPAFVHSAFYGVGAYAVAILGTRAYWPFWAGLVAGVVLSVFISWLIGLVLSRFRDDYYFLVSAALNIIILHLFTNWDSLTNGPLGLPGIARPSLFGFALTSNIAFLALSVLAVALTYLLCRFIVNSSYGRALKAIREDEDALKVFGYKTHRFKLLIFIISAALASVAGGLFASYITFIDPTTFSLLETVLVVSMVILGGLASLQGSLIGAFILVVLPEALRFVGFPSDIAAQMRQALYGLLLVILMMYRPQGIKGEFKL